MIPSLVIRKIDTELNKEEIATLEGFDPSWTSVLVPAFKPVVNIKTMCKYDRYPENVIIAIDDTSVVDTYAREIKEVKNSIKIWTFMKDGILREVH